jgi:hypothetical protein
MAKETMEFILQKVVVFEYNPFDLTDVLWRNALVTRQSDRLQPEFAFAVRRFDMDMRWFVPFIRVKMKSVCDPNFITVGMVYGILYDCGRQGGFKSLKIVSARPARCLGMRDITRG